jgi:hypothetical protein
MAIKEDGYIYWYWWAKYKKGKDRLVIVEVREFGADGEKCLNYELPGSDWGYTEEDFEFIQLIEEPLYDPSN